MVADQSLLVGAGSQDNGASSVSKQRGCSLIGRLNNATVDICPNDQCVLSVACGNKLSARRQGVHEPAAGGLQVNRGSIQSQLILHEAGCGRTREVRCERAHEQQINIGRANAGRVQRLAGRFDGQIAGPLIGGNLKRFMLLAGTEYFPPLSAFDDAILFWEDIGESWYDLAIYMEKLKHMRIFDRIGAFIVGQPVWINSFFDNIEHPTLQELVMEIVADYDFPVVSNMKFGHHTCSVPLPIGCQAMLDTAVPELIVTESAVC